VTLPGRQPHAVSRTPIPMKHWPALLVRFTPSTSTEAADIRDLVAAALDDLHPTAVQESETEWRVFFASAAARDLAHAALPVAAPGAFRVEAIDVPDEDWARQSQEDLSAVQVGRVTIAPPWRADAGTEPGTGRITIVIQPSMGFGTGHHASTRLCTALLQRLDLTGKTVLDVGTGSGVLALVAWALGARAVVAVDDDPDAIESARENLVLNGVADGIYLKAADFRTRPAQPADVVTANLTGGLLVRGARLLAEAVAPGGALIISGVLRDEEPEVLAAFAPALTLVERLSEDEWIGAWLTRASTVR
jgi:ribosomal protein L11 methyltransferase